MKKIILLISILLFSLQQTDAQTVWTQQYGVGGNLWAISFADQMHGTACGNYGTIVRTVNGGVTWTYQNGPASDFNVDVAFVNAQKGWIANFNSTATVGNILVSNNAGVSWQIQHTTNYAVRKLFFINDSTGWASCDNGFVLKTTDGGTNWIEYSTGTTEQLSGIFFTSLNEGWVCGFNGFVFHTTDGGLNWTTQSSGFLFDVVNIYFENSNVGWLCGGTSTCPTFARLYKTINGGASWQQQTTGPDWGGFNAIHFTDNMHGWAAAGSGCSTDHGGIFETTDGGISWQQDIIPDTTPVFALYVFNNYNLFSAGHDGYILHSSGNTTSVIENDQRSSFSIFPNPSGGLFTVQSSSEIKEIRITNYLGEEILNLIPNKEIEKIDLENFENGIYFATIRDKKNSSSIKLVKEN